MTCYRELNETCKKLRSDFDELEKQSVCNCKSELQREANCKLELKNLESQKKSVCNCKSELQREAACKLELQNLDLQKRSCNCNTDESKQKNQQQHTTIHR